MSGRQGHLAVAREKGVLRRSRIPEVTTYEGRVAWLWLVRVLKELRGGELGELVRD